MRHYLIEGSENMKKNRIKGGTTRLFCTLFCFIFAISLCIGAFTVTGSALQNKMTYRGERVILGGVPFGIKFHTVGAVVVGFADIDDISKTQSPAYLAGLRVKDVITKINGVNVENADQLTQRVEACGGEPISVTYRRGETERTVRIKPIYSKTESRYKTGIWVKDSGAGIGTLTFIVPETGVFGGLGHGICDTGTGELIPMSDGTVTNVNISSVKKGISGAPGELKGYFGTEKLGTLKANTECGLFGRLSSIPSGCDETVGIAMRGEITDGEAYIVCTVDGGEKKSYKAEVSSINREADGSKCFVITVKDPELISKTGGIVQGMSGSPILQNGKLIGAVTHVMVADPTVGYGIFIENMLAEAIN